MKHLEVVAAAIEYNNKILCMQRDKAKFDYISYKFEFPGGKVEPGEANHEALERELREEMDMDIEITESDHIITVEHTYPDFSITLHTFLCKVKSPVFQMKEHISFQWRPVEDMSKLDWAAADGPIVEYLQKHRS